ncbi:MAG: efflux transporter outer membrane subunit [Candidatus Omnitrophica bacterium]|nr:efflux transporter outer membrane subunit [Candidatus Omnitrophota bacterium]
MGTLLTFFVIPVVYVLVNRGSRRFVSAKAAAKVVVLLGVVSLVGGCAIVGREYVRPDAALPADWGAEWKIATPQDALPKGSWWALYNDEDLNALQEQATRYNHDLKSALAVVEKARALARVEKAAFVPAVDTNPAFERSRTTRNSFTAASAGISSFISERYTVPLDLSYELDVWGRVRRAFEAGFADAGASLADYYTVLLTLHADVARNYFLLRELDREIAIIDETIVLRQYAVNVVQDRVSGGITNELDFNRAKAELAKVKSDRIDLVRRRQGIEHALAVLCGQLPSEFSIDARAFEVGVPVIPLELPSVFLERRPDIAEAERRVAAANARIGVAQGAFFPKVTLTAAGGMQSVNADSLWDWESRYWSLGPGVSLPLFSGGRNRANLRAAEAEYDRTVEVYRQTVLQAVEEVQTALSDSRLRGEQALAQQEVLQTSRDAAALSMSRYREGLVTFLEVLDAERSRLDAELEASQIKTRQLISSVQLIKALGGSWGSLSDDH